MEAGGPRFTPAAAEKGAPVRMPGDGTHHLSTGLPGRKAPGSSQSKWGLSEPVLHWGVEEEAAGPKFTCIQGIFRKLQPCPKT